MFPVGNDTLAAGAQYTLAASEGTCFAGVVWTMGVGTLFAVAEANHAQRETIGDGIS